MIPGSTDVCLLKMLEISGTRAHAFYHFLFISMTVHPQYSVHAHITSSGISERHLIHMSVNYPIM
jgi:hypothetical protein